MAFKILSAIYFIMMTVTLYASLSHSTDPGHLRDRSKIYVVTKTITSAFMLVMVVMSFKMSYDPMLMGLIPAFGFCFMGDLFLALAHEIDNKVKNPQFIIGLTAFALAQVCFMLTIMRILNWHVAWISIIPFVMMGFNALKWKKTSFDYGGNKIPICVYACLVGMTAGLGIQLILSHPENTAYLFMGIGTLLFLFSDAILEIKLFWTREVKMAGLGVIIFYFTAVWCMGYAIILTV